MVIRTEAKPDGIGLRSIVKAGNGKYYCVDTCDTFDVGPETMVFHCGKSGEVRNWTDLYCRRYGDMETAKSGHNDTVENLDAILCIS